MTSGIHGDHPFATPASERDPSRQFRGRLASGVTVLTSKAGDAAGLTVSAITVAEGDPSVVLALVNPASDFFGELVNSERFVVHVLASADRQLSDEFAGLRPAPGGPFETREVSDSDWGPVLEEVPTRAFCSLGDTRDVGYLALIEGFIDRIELGDLSDPLVYFRGSYESLDK
ncbi:MAG: flavin reductase family protein [Acidimicrobiia bacterium]